MRYLKKFNESIDLQIYNQVFESIKDCFLEFEDNGWYWTQGSPDDNRISYHPIPHFKYIMKKDDDVDLNYKSFEFTGSIDSNNEILWETKYPIKKTQSEDFLDFMVSIKRLKDEIGIDFKFSYNNLTGYKSRIIIQGRI